jgi:hypothetical protein
MAKAAVMILAAVFGDLGIGAKGFQTHLPHRDRSVDRGIQGRTIG